MNGCVCVCNPDGRMIMKQVKPVEVSSFEEIAPQYFEHVAKAVKEGVCMYSVCMNVYCTNYLTCIYHT